MIDQKKGTSERLAVSEWIDQYKQNEGQNLLLSNNEVRGKIQHTIVARDGRNSPMGHKDILKIIQSVAGCTPKQADNYYCYAVEVKTTMVNSNNKILKL